MSTQTLDSLCSINHETLDAATPMDMEFRYLDISAVTKGRIDWSATKLWKYADAPSRARRRLRSRDVLLCTVRPGLQAHARIQQEADAPLVGSTGFAVLRPKLAADSGFVFHQIFSDSVALQLRALETGSSYPAVNEGDVKRVHVYCPEKEERWRIAAVLDRVDEAIAKTEAVIAKLRQVRAGLLHDLLTRGLDKNGQLRDLIAHPEQFQDSPLGCIPRDWHCTNFDEVLEGIDAGKSPDYPDYPAPPGEWGVLKVSAIWPEGFRPHENKWVTKAVHQVPAYQVQNGDLLISRSNTYELVGLVCLVENAPSRVILCDKTLRLRLKPKRGLNPFFCLLLQSRQARLQIEINATGTSASMKNISQDVIHGLRLAYPEVDEQRDILKVLQPANDELVALSRELSKLTNLKSGMMADLLTGHVRVSETIELIKATHGLAYHG